MRQMLNTAAYALAVTLAAAPVAYAQSTQVPAEVKAGAYVLEPSHSKITWSVNHLGFSTYIGQFTGVAGTLKLDPKAVQATDLQVTVTTASVGTLNTALDNHLKAPDFLDAAKFPTATFKTTSVKLTGERTADIAGDLTLRGVTKPIVIQATFNRAGIAPTDGKYTVGFSGKAQLKRSDFGIKAYLPVLGDEVTLDLAAEFKPAA
jgi:polyisoprenoid-binding protein YceI